MQQWQDTDSYDPLLGIDLVAEFGGNPEMPQLQEQQLPQLQQQQHHSVESSDASFALSLSPPSTCSSDCASPHSSSSCHHHHHNNHHQHQHQHGQPMPPFPEEELSMQQQLEQNFYPDAEGALEALPPLPDLKVEPAFSPEADSKQQQQQQQQRQHKRDDKICGVCGDRALGFNFDAVSCESCKAFFRRNAGKGVEAFKCPYSGGCSIDVSNRRYCKRCRLQKCFDIGMKKEYILTEQEKMEKRKKVDQNKLIRTLESLQLLPKDLSPAQLAERELLSESDLEAVVFLLDCYAASEAVKLPEPRLGQHAVSVDDLINFAELSAVRVVDMCKRLPEFQRLTAPDKLALLKGGSMELILLRGVISFDPDGARFLDAADVESADADAMTGGDFLKAAGQSGYAFLHLARSLRDGLQCDRATLVLLLVVCVFSPDRADLTPEGRDWIEESQVRHSVLLDRLLRTRLPVAEARKIYPQLLSQLAELRQLEKNFTDLAGLSDPRVVRPLMAEFLDMPEPDSCGAAAGRKRDRQQCRD